MKSLVIYFSRAFENYAVGNIKVGNTEIIARKIKEIIGATLFKCEPVKEYSKDYYICCKEAKIYQEKNARPELKHYLTDISTYDTIFIGGPVYYDEYPCEIYTQLDKLDFTGKIIKPFTTHEGSGLGSCVDVLKKKLNGTIIKEGLAIQGSKVNNNEAIIKLNDWINE